MSSLTLRGHFKGDRVILDEPVELEPNTRLLITVLPEGTDVREEEWLRLSESTLNAAYDEDEPSYGVDNLRKINVKSPPHLSD